MKILGSFVLLSLVIGCSTAPRQERVTAEIKSEENQEVKKEGLVSLQSNGLQVTHPQSIKVPNCHGCIVGSSSQGEESDNKKIYYLYGAEHLKLKNNYFDIPVVYNQKVQTWINYFITRGKDYFISYSQRAGRYAPVLSQILSEHGLPRDLIYLAMAESGFQNNAKSWAKAVGPWQFMPFTGRRYGLAIDWYVDERRDPIKATIAASKYLRDLYAMFESWELAAAGYNAGEGKISRAIKKYKTENFWEISDGKYLKRETKNYVPKIMALAIIGKNLSSFGFGDIDFHEPLDFDEIKVAAQTDLYFMAESLGLDIEDMKKWNPELLRWHTPPGQEYYVRVPVGLKSRWENCCLTADSLAKDFQVYTLNSTSSLESVARKFRVPVSVLAQLNDLAPTARIKAQDTVKLPFRVGQSKSHHMYADLYELPSRRAKAKKSFNSTLSLAERMGQKVSNPTEFYTVQKGDSLWTVAKKTGVSVHTLIRTNLSTVKAGAIYPGQKLAIR